MTPAGFGALPAGTGLHVWLKVPGQLQPQPPPVPSTQTTHLEAAGLWFSSAFLLEGVCETRRQRDPRVTDPRVRREPGPAAQQARLGQGTEQGQPGLFNPDSSAEPQL